MWRWRSGPPGPASRLLRGGPARRLPELVRRLLRGGLLRRSLLSFEPALTAASDGAGCRGSRRRAALRRR